MESPAKRKRMNKTEKAQEYFEFVDDENEKRFSNVKCVQEI